MKTLSPATSRSAGVLLHVTSLPSAYGIGDFGPAAYAWVDALAGAGQTWWQVLPLNAPDASNSPYSAHSAFGGNAFLISPELLLRDALLTRDQMPPSVPHGPANFTRVRRAKRAMLTAAFEQFRAGGAKRLREPFERFKRSEAWLDDFALFIALREQMPTMPWPEWPNELVRRKPAAILRARHELSDAIERQRFVQFLFWRQVDALRAHARERGVRILGDVPIYISLDSADVWANPHLFQLGRDRKPKAVAGVPPDMFSATGQRWGNPLFDWNAMRRDGFAWWIARVKASLRQADVIRIDHFRGLAAYWSIPAAAPTATAGRWVDAPGGEMLDAVRAALGDLPLVAEDLGIITSDVTALRERFGMAGMRVLQFAFDGHDNANLPHRFDRNTIVYPGNHDNDTTAGWWRALPKDGRDRARRYAPDIAADPSRGLIRLALGSVADRAIVTLQDALGLGSTARMNTPGSASDKLWAWRATPEQTTPDALAPLAELTATYFRRPPA